jgi:ABC-type nickel/cobalt efflux system permease component RcnA
MRQVMAKTVEIKIPEDIEFRVLGNAFGLLIASAGLLAGEMIRLRSFDYWLDDIVPLLLVIWMAFRMFRNFLSTMTAYQDDAPSATADRDRHIRETLKSEQAAVAQITAKTGYTAEQVVEQVAKRIEAQKAEAMKKNKS